MQSTAAPTGAVGRQRRATLPLSNRSFDSIRLGNAISPNNSDATEMENSGSRRAVVNHGGAVVAPMVGRRGSFLYRSPDSISDISPMSLSRKLSTSDACQSSLDDVIVTPFAQILQSLRAVHENFLVIANLVGTDRTKRKQIQSSSDEVIVDAKLLGHQADDGEITARILPVSDESPVKLAEETLKELEWCLVQLEKMQTHRPVADMATNKFKRLLNRELNHFSESSASGSEICEYICNTFLDNQDDLQSPVFNGDESTIVDTDETSGCSSRRRSHQDPLHTGLRSISEVSEVSLAVAAQLAILESDPCERDPRLNECLTMLNDWGPDIFQIAEATNNRPLAIVVYSILKDLGALTLLKIQPSTMVSYLTQLECHYPSSNPYHNSMHAADVAQSINVLLRRPKLENVFTDLEMLAAIFAGAIHDADHPGVTSQYLINSGRELALLYNDQSVLENHHLAVAFKLLQSSDADIFENLPLKSYQTLRRLVIEMVLATDMSKHMALVADLKTMVETRRVSGSGVLHLENYSDRSQVLKTLVHCADLSNPTKPIYLYCQWTERIMEEFFRQGDMEREGGLDISPMCDRHQASVDQSQLGFIDFIAHPLWETWAELVHPDCADILDNLQMNREWFRDRVQQQQQQDQRLQRQQSQSQGQGQANHRQHNGVVEEENEDCREDELVHDNDDANR